MEYNFQKINIGSGFKYDGLTVTETGVCLSKSFIERRVGKDEDVQIAYDVGNNIVLVTPVKKSEDNEAYNVDSRGRVKIKIGQFMPKGRYYFQPIVGEFNGFICTLTLAL